MKSVKRGRKDQRPALRKKRKETERENEVKWREELDYEGGLGRLFIRGIWSCGLFSQRSFRRAGERRGKSMLSDLTPRKSSGFAKASKLHSFQKSISEETYILHQASCLPQTSRDMCVASKISSLVGVYLTMLPRLMIFSRYRRCFPAEFWSCGFRKTNEQLAKPSEEVLKRG